MVRMGEQGELGRVDLLLQVAPSTFWTHLKAMNHSIKIWACILRRTKNLLIYIFHQKCIKK